MNIESAPSSAGMSVAVVARTAEPANRDPSQPPSLSARPRCDATAQRRSADFRERCRRGALNIIGGLLLAAPLATVHAATVPSPDAKPGVVVAVIDTGINPYHNFFHAGSRIYPASNAPSAVTQPLLKSFGIDTRPECWITLTRTGKPDADFAADASKWTAAAACELVWFVGTNVLARSFAPGSRAYLPDADDDTHGVGTSAAVLTANPEAVVLFLEGTGAEAESFAFAHPSVDIVSTSYGPIGSLPFVGSIESSYDGVHKRGKLHFGACDNSPSTGIQDGTCGPWWSIGLAGFEETQNNEAEPASNGRQAVSGTFPDFLSDFNQALPYCATCQTGEQVVGGTSFATPRSAGTASRVLLLARRAMAQSSGTYIGSGGTLMAAGHIGKKSVAFSNWQLRRALELSAWVPEFSDYDPIGGVFEQSYPIPPETPWLVLGWGVLTPDTKAGVIDRSLVALGVNAGTVPVKDNGFCDFQNSLIAIRKTYWDSVEPTSQTFGNPPSPDPFIYCDSFAGAIADVPSGPQDSDGDGIADADDNCPTAANANQADGDGDGKGNACDSTNSSVDGDGDGVADADDNCPAVANSNQKDSDGDGKGDACDTANPAGDADGDGIADATDNCPAQGNANQADADQDGIGDACDNATTPGELSCSEAFDGLPAGANVAAVDPRLQYNKPGHLILSFADDKSRDEAARRLKTGSWLPVKVAKQVYSFRHLRSVRVPLPLVTPEIVKTLRKASQGLSLISIWGEHPRKSLIDTSVPLIGVDAARDAFASSALPLTGRGIGVAIIDTGVDATHGDLKAVKHNVRMAGNVAIPYDDLPANNTEVNNGHGTHIAGTIAGDGARSSGRYVGVAPEADLVGIAVDVGAPYFFVLEAMDYVLEQRAAYNIRVTNHSYGPATGTGFRFDPADPDAQAIKALHDAGIIPVFAAGNSGPDADTISADAQNPCALGVAAGNRQFQLASFSSRGTADGAAFPPDITAPGVDITASRAINGLASTGVPSSNSPPYYSSISGTSMAAPHVVGVIALLLEAKPDLTFEKVRNLLVSTAMPMKDASNKAYAKWEVGAGYIDALGAVAKALGKPKPAITAGVVPGPGITEVAQYQGSSGLLTTPLACLGCGSDPEFGFHRYTYQLPVKVSKLTATLDWSSPGEVYSLEIMGPDGKSKGFAGFDPREARGAPTPGATSIAASASDAMPGTYTFLVRESLGAGSLPNTLTVTTECAASGCSTVAPTASPVPTATPTSTATPTATALPTASPTASPSATPVPDSDGDGVPNGSDNCHTRSNPGQGDVDGDGAGDACDTVNNKDPDGDGINDANDNCPTTSNPGQEDRDADGAGDACDSVNNDDPDSDGVANAQDNCPTVSNASQTDSDGDGIGDACDGAGNSTDNDGDGVVNGNDNCPNAPNPGQADADGDGAGDVCDSVNNSDNDGDGVANASDNCPAAPNPGQADADGDGAGDVCDNVNHTDQDSDGVQAANDNCPNTRNPNQADIDGDGTGDACDSVNNLDDDGDGVADQNDNCPAVPNQNQNDMDGDGVGDRCDATFNDDTDGDGIVNSADNCPSVPNRDQANQDQDGFGDACDADQGNGGGTAKVNRASNGPIVADVGTGIRIGDLILRNTSQRAHRVSSIQLKLTNPENIARIYGTVQGVRFLCAPAQPAALNTCVADAVLELQPGQSLKVDIWVELASTAGEVQQLSAIGLTTGGGGLMLIGTLGLGLGRRRIGSAALVAAAMMLTACNGGGQDPAPPPSVADGKSSAVTIEAVHIRDDVNAPVDYGVPPEGSEIGLVRAD